MSDEADGILPFEEAIEVASEGSGMLRILKAGWVRLRKHKVNQLLDNLEEAYRTDNRNAEEELEAALEDPRKAELFETLIDSSFSTSSHTARKALAYIYAGLLQGIDEETKRMMLRALSELSSRDVSLFLWLHETGFDQHDLNPSQWSPLNKDFRCEIERAWLIEASNAPDVLGDWVLARGEFTWRLKRLISRGLLLPDPSESTSQERTSWGYSIDHQTFDYWRLLKTAKTGDTRYIGFSPED